MTIPDLAPAAPSRTVLIDAYPLGEHAPGVGTVTFTLLSDLRVLSAGQIIQASTVTVKLVDGKGAVRLPTRSTAVTDDCGDDWVILVKKSWASQPYAIQVPTGTSDLNLGDLAPARPLTRRENLWAITAASVSVETLAPGSNASGTVSVNGGALDFRIRVPRGEKGLPGPGAVAADTAVAGYINTTSQTSTALNRAYRRGYSPREFGVVGNGTTDDTAAWNTALSSVPAGATITCPEGDRYKLTGPVNASKPVTIENGEFLPRNTGACIQISASDVTLRGVKFTSTTASPPEATHRIINAVGTSSARLRNITVENCTIDKTRYIGVWLEWCEDVTVVGNRITDFQYAGIIFISVNRGEASSNIIRNGLQEGGIANTYGIAATDLANTLAARSRDILITRNLVDNIPRWEGIDTHGGERITITDNVVTRCYDGISAVGGSSSRVSAPRSVVISGNTIDSMGISGVRSAIRFYGIQGGEQATGLIGSNQVRGGYVLDVEAKYFEEPSTTIQAQASTAPNVYANHPAPFRQWNAVTRIYRNGSSTTHSVSFPAGVFTRPPMVFLTEQPGRVATVQGWSWMVQSVTTTEVVIYGEGPVGVVDIQMGVLAVQMGSIAAGGIPRS